MRYQQSLNKNMTWALCAYATGPANTISLRTFFVLVVAT